MPRPFLIFALLLPALSHAQKVEVDLVPEPRIAARLKSGSVPPRDRQAKIAGIFAEAGCPTTVQPVTKRTGNVICTLPGDTTGQIVIGGHFDFIDRGEGLVDDWSGASLLPSLFESLKNRPHRHTFVFVAFAAEEQGLVGSSRYVKSLSEDQRSSTLAFVNLECLGLAMPEVWSSRATPLLVDFLAQIASVLHIPLQGVNVDRVGDDDSHSFLAAKIPVISIHSLTGDTVNILHSRRDNLSAIHPDFYYASYKLAAFYLAYLDLKLP